MTRYPSETLRALLAKHMLFRDVSATVLDALTKFATVRHAAAHEAIFEKGDPGNALFGVLAGRVRIYTVSADGVQVVLNILEPGEIFGEIALLDGGRRTASARCMEATDLLQIHREHFLPFLRRNPELCVSMIHVLCGRIRMDVDFIEDTVFLHLRARLAKRLLTLAEAHGKPAARGVRLDIKLSQQDLAHMIGATRERVNKELNLWREQNLIAMEGGEITLCQPEQLSELLKAEAI